MTNTNGYRNDARLNQLAATAAANTQAIAANTQAIAGLREQQEDIKTELQGLQLENRRMLEELRGRRVDLLNERSI